MLTYAGAVVAAIHNCTIQAVIAGITTKVVMQATKNSIARISRAGIFSIAGIVQRCVSAASFGFNALVIGTVVPFAFELPSFDCEQNMTAPTVIEFASEQVD